LERDSVGFSDTLETRGDIDTIAHQIAVALLDYIAQMDTDTELDTTLGRQAGVPLDHAVLHLNSASQSIDDAAKLDKTSVTCAFHHPPVMRADVTKWRNCLGPGRSAGTTCS
jgi:hypothetical protein